MKTNPVKMKTYGNKIENRNFLNNENSKKNKWSGHLDKKLDKKCNNNNAITISFIFCRRAALRFWAMRCPPLSRTSSTQWVSTVFTKVTSFLPCAYIYGQATQHNIPVWNLNQASIHHMLHEISGLKRMPILMDSLQLFNYFMTLLKRWETLSY